jgi:uncharacterized membrane protein YfhO
MNYREYSDRVSALQRTLQCFKEIENSAIEAQTAMLERILEVELEYASGKSKGKARLNKSTDTAVTANNTVTDNATATVNADATA